MIAELLGEVASYGTATVKRASGDWTTPQLGRWKDVLHGGRVDGFCLLVYGFGERKTPKPFVAACDKFIFTEILRRPEAAPAEVAAEAPLGQVGTLLLMHDPSFDPRNFGFKKLSELVRAQSDLELKTVPGSQGAHLTVRLREG